LITTTSTLSTRRRSTAYRGDVANLSDAELGLPTRCDGSTVEHLIQHMNAEHVAILNLFSDPLALPRDVRTAEVVSRNMRCEWTPSAQTSVEALRR
jgi:hypothetical protein